MADQRRSKALVESARKLQESRETLPQEKRFVCKSPGSIELIGGPLYQRSGAYSIEVIEGQVFVAKSEDSYRYFGYIDVNRPLYHGPGLSGTDRKHLLQGPQNLSKADEVALGKEHSFNEKNADFWAKFEELPAEKPVTEARSGFGRTGQGAQGGTYKCRSCGKITRKTDPDSAGLGLCGYCYDEAGLENELNDGFITQEEYDEQVAELKKRYQRPVTESARQPRRDGTGPHGQGAGPGGGERICEESEDSLDESTRGLRTMKRSQARELEKQGHSVKVYDRRGLVVVDGKDQYKLVEEASKGGKNMAVRITAVKPAKEARIDSSITRLVNPKWLVVITSDSVEEADNVAKQMSLYFPVGNGSGPEGFKRSTDGKSIGVWVGAPDRKTAEGHVEEVLRKSNLLTESVRVRATGRRRVSESRRPLREESGKPFWRLSNKGQEILWQISLGSNVLGDIYESVKAGHDFPMERMKELIESMQKIVDSAKQFSDASQVEGTEYE